MELTLFLSIRFTISARPEIQSRIQVTYPEVMRQTRQNKSEFVWTEISSVEELGRLRMASMDRFLDDYDVGQKCGRYMAAELPSLPFQDKAFELSLCSHFLFLYADQFNLEFHVQSVVELCRVANEVRIFPLLGLGGVSSRHLSPVTETLRRLGMSVKIETVNYEFQRGGNQMLRIINKLCIPCRPSVGKVFVRHHPRDTRFLAHEISTGKRRRGAFETDLA